MSKKFQSFVVSNCSQYVQLLLNVRTLVIYRFITCATEYSQKILICLYFFEELQHNQII